MLARLIHDLTKGRLRLPFRTGASATPGDMRVDGRVPRLVSDETTPRDMRILTDLDLNTPGNPPALRADGTLDPTVIPSTSSGGAVTGSDLVGEIKPWAGQPLRVPSGWLACDGAEALISAYPSLFAVLGYQWGRPSNPSLYFKLPNFVGRTLIGGLGPNDASAGRVHKINVRSPGANYIPGTYAGLALIADSPASFATPATVTVTVGAGGGVERIDIVTAGQVSGVQPVTGESNCSLRIPVTSIPGGAGFTYDVYLAPTSTAAQPWTVRMTNRGEGYATTPTVVVTGPSLVGATAVAVLDGDTVREVIITNPGTGDPTGATVTLSGGSPSTNATASIVFGTSPAVAGDLGGEQQHGQLRYEVGGHFHIQNNGAFGGGFAGIESQGTGDTAYRKSTFVRTNTQRITNDASSGNSLETIDVQPMNLRPLYAGVTYLIRAA